MFECLFRVFIYVSSGLKVWPVFFWVFVEMRPYLFQIDQCWWVGDRDGSTARSRAGCQVTCYHCCT